MIEQASLVLGNGNWAVKSDSLLGYRTIDGKYYQRDMTFTRATTGTRVNEAGLVELVPYNLLQYSEQFDNAAWAKAAASITANTTTAPNGTLTADTLTADGTFALHAITQVGNSINGTTYTHSIYAKKNTNDFIQLFGTGAIYTSATVFANFDLNLGVVGLVGAGTTASIQSVGNGWYRCTMTATATATASGSFIAPCLVTSTTSSRAESNSLSTSVFVWGAQLVEGTEPLDYLPTTDRLDIARIDYSAGEPALLLEPQRTNLLLQSSSFDSGAWGKTAVSVTANTTTSPSGVIDADTFSADGTNSFHGIYQSASVVSGTTYTISIYAKKNTNNFIQLFAGSLTFGSNVWANFDLNNGVVGSVGSATTASIQNAGNGWYRCIITGAAISTTSNLAPFYSLVTSETSPRAEVNTLSTSVFLWGAQLEAGSYSTSYIPTTSASVTRNRDVCVKTGISSLINSTEGVLYAEINALKYPVDVNNWLTITDGTNANSVGIQFETNGKATGRIEVGGVGQASITTSVDYSNFIKVAFKYKENDFAWWVNGVEVGTDLSGITFPSNTLNSLQFAYGAGGNNWNGNVQNVMVFPTVLSDDELATLTTI